MNRILIPQEISADVLHLFSQLKNLNYDLMDSCQIKIYEEDGDTPDYIGKCSFKPVDYNIILSDDRGNVTLAKLGSTFVSVDSNLVHPLGQKMAKSAQDTIDFLIEFLEKDNNCIVRVEDQRKYIFSDSKDGFYLNFKPVNFIN